VALTHAIVPPPRPWSGLFN